MEVEVACTPSSFCTGLIRKEAPPTADRQLAHNSAQTRAWDALLRRQELGRASSRPVCAHIEGGYHSPLPAVACRNAIDP